MGGRRRRRNSYGSGKREQEGRTIVGREDNIIESEASKLASSMGGVKAYGRFLLSVYYSVNLTSVGGN